MNLIKTWNFDWKWGRWLKYGIQTETWNSAAIFNALPITTMRLKGHLDPVCSHCFGDNHSSDCCTSPKVVLSLYTLNTICIRYSQKLLQNSIFRSKFYILIIFLIFSRNSTFWSDSQILVNLITHLFLVNLYRHCLSIFSYY